MSISPIVSDDISCTACGYSLHLLDSDGICPECGREVALSIQSLRQREAAFGPALQEHSVGWLRKAGIGFFVFLAGGAVIVLADIFTRSATRWWMLTAGQGISLIGVWLFTIRPVEPKRRAEWLRWTTRAALATWFIANAVSHIGMAVSDQYIGGDGRMWVALWACAIGTLSGYFYLAHLAGRMRTLLLRRVCLALTVIPILMSFVVIKTMQGIFSPTMFGVALPWPAYPFVAQAEMLIYVTFFWARAFGGQTEWGYFFKEVIPVCVFCVVAISALLWYGMVLLSTSSRLAQRMVDE